MARPYSCNRDAFYYVRSSHGERAVTVAVSAITFTLGQVGPGDPVEVILGNQYSEERADRLRESLGLNRPFFVQYGDYVWRAMRGDLSESYVFRRPVGSIIVSKMWVSAQLGIAASIISVGLGIPLGFFIAHRQGRWQDPATSSTGSHSKRRAM